MTMLELSGQYRDGAAQIKERIELLRNELGSDMRRMDELRLRSRILTLCTMYREMAEAAVCLERYYDKGYRINAKFRI